MPAKRSDMAAWAFLAIAGGVLGNAAYQALVESASVTALSVLYKTATASRL
ncbi:hypothetical protein [Actinoplanes sp. NPDC023714]|uniref:hypothetical protein n=1 Tax=Actinoplanes sp. NPDC023714 TaxID=3154322 RepID=UPI0033F2B0B9